MAIIGKIRQKQGLLVVLIGVALLIFVVDPSTIWNRISGQGGEQPIGEFYGEPMYDSEWNYEARVTNAINAKKNEKFQNNQDPVLTEYETDVIRGQVWQQMVMDSILNTQIDLLGLAVTGTEMNDPQMGILFGADPIDFLKEEFTNEEGNFDRDSLNRSLMRLINAQAQNQVATQQLASLEWQARTSRIREKYISMVKLGMIATTQDAKRNFAEENTKANIKYVLKDYTSIPDSAITVTDQEIKTYFDAHQYEKKWEQQTEMRSIKYVSFDIEPSEADKENANNRLSNLKKAFETSKNDSMFVANNATTPIGAMMYNRAPDVIDVFPPMPYARGVYSNEIDEAVLAAAQGQVVGPYLHGNKSVLIKVRESGLRNEATVRHILIKSGVSDEDDLTKKALADSILQVVKADTSKFTEMVELFTEDPGSKFTGGVYEWFPEGQMVPEFNDFSFKQPIGSLDMVETSYGYHIVEVLGQAENEFKMIAVVDSEIRPSKETQQEVYETKGLALYEQAAAGDFDKTAEEFGLVPIEINNIRLDYPNLQSLPKNMTLLKWAFNSEVGSISEPEYIGDEKVVVAYLVSETHEGVAQFDGVKDLMKPEVIKEKKAAMIKEQLAGVTNIDDAATKLNAVAQSAELNLSMNNLPNQTGNSEASLIGTIFTMKTGETSPVIAGENGVYMILVENNTSPAYPEDLSVNQGTVTGLLRTQAEGRLAGALLKSCGLKDWRMKRTVMN